MLGIKIRQSREQQGISQEKLAELVGVSRQAVSKWELEQASPTIDNLKRTEEALGLPPGTLIELAAAEELEPDWLEQAAIVSVTHAARTRESSFFMVFLLIHSLLSYNGFPVVKISS